MGGVQVTVSWSTDVLATAMFPTGSGVATEEEGSRSLSAGLVEVDL